MKGRKLRRLLVGAVAAALAAAAVHAVRSGWLAEALYEADMSRLAASEPVPAPAAGDMAFVGVSLVPMTGPEVISGQTVIVRAGRITRVGPDSSVIPPPGMPVVEAAGAFLMPALADMHVHDPGTPQSLVLYLANGVTRVRDTGGSERMREWGRRIAAGEILGPAVYSTGPILRGKPRGPGSVVLTNAAEAEAEVAREFAAGVRAIKPYTGLSRTAYNAAMAAAKARGMYAIGHIPYSVGLEGVVAAGQDEVAHVHSFHPEFLIGLDPEDPFAEYDIALDRMAEIVATVNDAGMAVTTTLHVNEALTAYNEDRRAYLERPAMAYAPASALWFMESPRFAFATWPPDYMRHKYLPWLHALTRAFQEGGVRLVLGTDAGAAPGLVPGLSAHAELRLLVAAGLSPHEALLTATVNAAAVAGEAGDWGTLQEGRRADLLLVSANPLDDVANAGHILGVMAAGRWLDRAALDGLLAAVRRDYGTE